MYLSTYVIVPQSINILGESPSSLKVLIKPIIGSTPPAVYKVFSGSSSCQVQGDAIPLACSLRNLMGATQYLVAAIACAKSGVCSHATLGQGYTLPDRTFIPLSVLFSISHFSFLVICSRNT